MYLSSVSYLSSDSFFQEVRWFEPWKPQYLDGKGLHRGHEVQLIFFPDGFPRAWGTGAHPTSTAVLLKTVLGPEPGSLWIRALNLSSQYRLLCIELLGFFCPGPNDSCSWASALLYGFSPFFLTRPSSYIFFNTTMVICGRTSTVFTSRHYHVPALRHWASYLTIRALP